MRLGATCRHTVAPAAQSLGGQVGVNSHFGASGVRVQRAAQGLGLSSSRSDPREVPLGSWLGALHREARQGLGAEAECSLPVPCLPASECPAPLQQGRVESEVKRV